MVLRQLPATLAALAAGVALTLAVHPPASAQGPRPSLSRMATHLSALVTYPAFFNGQPVRVRGDVGTGTIATLAEGEAVVVMAGRARLDPMVDGGRRVEVTGTFVDVARLPEGDPRLRDLDVEGLSRARLGKPSPGNGELLVVLADAIEDVDPPTSASLRGIALDPARYLDERVTVSGRFRGRNLFGDQPNAPGRSQWDFVIQSGDASIWVTGMRPRGRGFNFEVTSRLDTTRWLDVTGVVRADRGLVWIEATALREVDPADEPAVPDTVVPVAIAAPRPEVVFSAPTADEVDVALDTSVRIQFSRDMDPTSFGNQVRVRYLAEDAVERGEPSPPPVEVNSRYDGGRRMLELRFGQPLDRFRTVEVELGDGITATDGQALVPWTLRFTLGG